MTNKLLRVVLPPFIALVTAIPLTAAAENHSGASAVPPSTKAKIAKVAGFQYGEIYVHTKERTELMKLAKEWKASPSWTTITVEGHGYVPNNEEESIRLGEMRAERVRNLLVKYGVDAKHVVAVGHSRAEPGRWVDVTIDECITEGCRR